MSDTINKNEFIKRISERTNFTQGQVKTVLDAMLTAIPEYAQDGKNVRFMGFGTFSKKHFNERQGHNPQNGEPLTIPAHDALGFSSKIRF